MGELLDTPGNILAFSTYKNIGENLGYMTLGTEVYDLSLETLVQKGSEKEPFDEQAKYLAATLATVQHTRSVIQQLSPETAQKAGGLCADLSMLNAEIFWSRYDELHPDLVLDYADTLAEIRQLLPPIEDPTSGTFYGNGQLFDTLSYRFYDDAVWDEFDAWTDLGELFGDHCYLEGASYERFSPEGKLPSRLNFYSIASSGVVEAAIIGRKLTELSGISTEVTPVFFTATDPTKAPIICDNGIHEDEDTIIIPFDDNIPGSGRSAKVARKVVINRLIDNRKPFANAWLSKYARSIDLKAKDKKDVLIQGRKEIHRGTFSNRKIQLEANSGPDILVKTTATPLQAAIEAGVSEVYTSTGLPTVDVDVLSSSSVITDMVTTTEGEDLTEEGKQVLKAAFVTAVALNDYDRLPQNIITGRIGENDSTKPYLFDFGGAMISRANGGYDGIFPEIGYEEVLSLLRNPKDYDKIDNHTILEMLYYDNRGRLILRDPEALRASIEYAAQISDESIHHLAKGIAQELQRMDIPTLIDTLEVQLDGFDPRTHDYVKTDRAIEFFIEYLDDQAKRDTATPNSIYTEAELEEMRGTIYIKTLLETRINNSIRFFEELLEAGVYDPEERE